MDTNNESDTFYKPIFGASQNDLNITPLQLNSSKEEIGEKGAQMLAIQEVNSVDPGSKRE